MTDIIIDVFLTVVGLFFTMAAATRHTVYDTNNRIVDCLIVSILWLNFFVDNLLNVVDYFKM